jgi:hypothetical protein
MQGVGLVALMVFSFLKNGWTTQSYQECNTEKLFIQQIKSLASLEFEYRNFIPPGGFKEIKEEGVWDI